ncbi:hypothetical protein PHMEG_00033178, partial [Phytophthora megakarya]
CPNLIELTLSGDLVDIQLDFTKYRLATKPIPELTFVWDHVTEITKVLSDPSYPLTKCTRHLKVYLLPVAIPPDMARNFDFYVDALVDMLEANERLKFVDVFSPDPKHEREINSKHNRGNAKLLF